MKASGLLLGFAGEGKAGERVKFPMSHIVHCQKVEDVVTSLFISFQVQTPPLWVVKPSPVKGIELEKAEFFCDAAGTPHPHYTWVDWEGRDALDKEGWTLEKDTGHLVRDCAVTRRGTICHVTERGLFFLCAQIAYRLKYEDTGMYKCIAENPAGRIESEAYLKVIVRPKVQELYNKTLAVGLAEGKIVCKASGDPLPQIIWRKWSQK